MESALKSERSCVASYPTYMGKGILFMWPWKEDVLSVANNPQACPEGMLEALGDNPKTYTRDLPYGWDALVENLIDPAHVPFAHHGMQGSRKDDIPINMTTATDNGERSFSFYWEDRAMGKMRAGNVNFIAPFVVAYEANFESKDGSDEKKPLVLTALCIPTKPGWSRAIIVTAASKEGPKKKSIVAKIFSKLPIWLVHQLSNRFLDSDLVFLHFQEWERQRNDDYYTPSPADRCIQALRKWVPKYTDICDGQQLPPSPPRSVLFDRYTQHTSHCKHCQQGLESIKTWRRAAYATLAVSIFGFKFKVDKASTLVCLAALRLMHKLERRFKEGEFKHFENH
jgi:pheophorbide a oxygenase